jgi:hypothetical protein
MLKKASKTVEVFELDGSKIYAVRPDKAAYDEYTDKLFDRTEGGELIIKTGRAIEELYRACVKKLENVEIDGELKAEVTDGEAIVSFLRHLGDPSAGRKIDNWLLGLSELTKAEAKN